MAKGKSSGYIVLEILAVVLAVVLWFVLTEPPKIWEVENSKTDQCRNQMDAFYRAEKYFKMKNGSYSFDMNTLMSFLHNDSSLQNRKNIVILSKKLDNNLNQIFSVPAIENFQNIYAAINEIKGDLKANEHYFQIDTNFVLTADSISQAISRLYDPAMNVQSGPLFVFMDSLANLKRNLSNYRLQIASQKAVSFSDSIRAEYETLDINSFRSTMSGLTNAIMDFAFRIKASKLGSTRNIFDRLKKFSSIITKSLTDLPGLNRNEQLVSLKQRMGNLKQLHEDFLKPENFNLTNRLASLALEEDDTKLLSIQAGFDKCPDNGKQYIMKVGNSGNLAVECPNLVDFAKERIQPELDKISGYALWKADSAFVKATDSLLKVIAGNKNNLRKHRDYFMAYKAVQKALLPILNEEILSIKFVKNINHMLDTISNDFRISLAEKEFEKNLNALDSIAARCQKKNFKYLDKQVSEIEKNYAQLDSVSKEIKMNRKERRNYVDTQPVFEFWKQSVDQFKNAFNPSYANTLIEMHENLQKSIEETKNGVNTVSRVIFYENHQNHGNVDNGQASWE